MPVSSLSKMSVLTDGAGSNQGLLMPKLKYRFRVLFENFGVNQPVTELTKQVIDFTRPSVNFDDITIDVYNSRLRLAGKHTWEDVTVNLRDDASGSVAALVGQQLQKQMDFLEQASAAAGIDYKFLTKCEILDGGNGTVEPVILETWELYGCYITSANYNDLNYSSSEPVTVALTLRFDNALQTQSNTGFASQIGRTARSIQQAGGPVTSIAPGG